MIIESMRQQREELKKLAKKERNEKQYSKTKNDPVTCEVCGSCFSKYYLEKHVETARHKKWVGLLEKRNEIKKQT